MLAPPFKALQDTANAAVLQCLVNSTATVGGVACRAIFDQDSAIGTVGVAGMATSQPAITVLTADLPADPYDLPVEVQGCRYVVAQAEPDGTGLTRLLLETAA